MAARSKTTTPRIPTPRRSAKTLAAPPPVVPPSDPAPPSPKGKLGAVVALLGRPDGAAIVDLMAATGWQAHSVRGAISGALKKKLGLNIVSDKTEAGRVYRIVQKGAA